MHVCVCVCEGWQNNLIYNYLHPRSITPPPLTSHSLSHLSLLPTSPQKQLVKHTAQREPVGCERVLDSLQDHLRRHVAVRPTAQDTQAASDLQSLNAPTLSNCKHQVCILYSPELNPRHTCLAHPRHYNQCHRHVSTHSRDTPSHTTHSTSQTLFCLH